MCGFGTELSAGGVTNESFLWAEVFVSGENSRKLWRMDRDRLGLLEGKGVVPRRPGRTEGGAGETRGISESGGGKREEGRRALCGSWCIFEKRGGEGGLYRLGWMLTVMSGRGGEKEKK